MKKKAEERLKLCNVCAVRTGKFCDPQKSGISTKTQKIATGCGCVIPAKAMAKADTYKTEELISFPQIAVADNSFNFL